MAVHIPASLRHYRVLFARCAQNQKSGILAWRFMIMATTIPMKASSAEVWDDAATRPGIHKFRQHWVWWDEFLSSLLMRRTVSAA
jgi:hypothetical protein